MAEIFFKDKTKIFECKVLVEGASIENTQARLVLKFPEQNHLYYGKIDENNVCTIEVPALKEIKGTKGEAILEVIADSTFFESWSGEIELKQSKSVKVEMISKDKKPINEAPKVSVELKEEKKIEPKIENKEPKKEIIKKVVSPKQKLLLMFKESKVVPTKGNLNTYFPSYMAAEISEQYGFDNKESLNFQYFLDKKIRPEKLKKILNLIKK